MWFLWQQKKKPTDGELQHPNFPERLATNYGEKKIKSDPSGVKSNMSLMSSVDSDSTLHCIASVLLYLYNVSVIFEISSCLIQTNFYHV